MLHEDVAASLALANLLQTYTNKGLYDKVQSLPVDMVRRVLLAALNEGEFEITDPFADK